MVNVLEQLVLYRMATWFLLTNGQLILSLKKQNVP